MDHVSQRTPDLGDLVIVLLASTLAGLRDRLASDGFVDAADLVADLIEAAYGYVARDRRVDRVPPGR